MNLTVNQPTSTNFKAKLPTKDILEVTTGRVLGERGIRGVYNVCNTITEQSNFTHELLDVAPTVCKALYEQFPILKEITKDSEKFFKEKKSYEEIQNWVNKQIKKIGSTELDVKTLKEWNV